VKTIKVEHLTSVGINLCGEAKEVFGGKDEIKLTPEIVKAYKSNWAIATAEKLFKGKTLADFKKEYNRLKKEYFMQKHGVSLKKKKEILSAEKLKEDIAMLFYNKFETEEVEVKK